MPAVGPKENGDNMLVNAVKISTPVKVSLLVILVACLFCDVRTGSCQTGRTESSHPDNCSDQRSEGTSRILAVINGRAITEKEIDATLGTQLYSLQEKIYDLRKRALETLTIQLVLREEATKRGLAYEDLKKQMMPESAEVKQSDIDRAYTDNLSALENTDEDEAKQRIRLDLESQIRFAKYKSAVASLVTKAKVETFLLEPSPPLSTANMLGPSRGPTDASVTVVVFSDFQCPYCRQAAVAIKPLLQEYAAVVRFIFKQMPLAIHPDAFRAAQASVCAQEQGRFWEYHDLLFGAGDLSERTLKKYASDLGLINNGFNECMASEASAAMVRKDMVEARQADVQGTPTFFVNGRIVRGMKSGEDLKRVIDQALAQSRLEPKRTSTR